MKTLTLIDFETGFRIFLLNEFNDIRWAGPFQEVPVKRATDQTARAVNEVVFRTYYSEVRIPRAQFDTKT